MADAAISPSAVVDEHALAETEAIYRARRGLLNFIKFTKPDYEINWHHRVVCRAINAVVDGSITRLLVTMAPRHGKSQIISRHLPAYVLGRNPDAQIVCASYGAKLAQSMGRAAQRIIMSPSYRALFPDTRLAAPGIKREGVGTYLLNADKFEVVGRRGQCLSVGVGGALTGEGTEGGGAICDDLTRNMQDALSPAYRERAWEWFNSVLRTRLAQKSWIIMTMTRWHEDDVPGRVLQQMLNGGEQWTVIELPAIKEAPPTDIDPRQPGEALWPQRFPLSALQTQRKVSERTFAALYQCRPAPLEGNIVKRTWWKFYRPSEMPAEVSAADLHADLTFKDTEKGSFAVMQVWAAHRADKYLLTQRRARVGFSGQVEMMRALVREYPQMQGKYIEDAANGQALISLMRNEVAGLVALKPKGSKLARAEAVAYQIEGGNVYLPHPDTAPWVNDFIEEWALFPNGKNDDQVDCCSQALNHMENKTKLGDFRLPQFTHQSMWKSK